jgi:hypothetical protein
MHTPRFPRLIARFVAGFLIFTGLALPLANAQTKPKPSEQLYVEVSALGSLDYFYDHKMGLQEAGKAMGGKN